MTIGGFVTLPMNFMTNRPLVYTNNSGVENLNLQLKYLDVFKTAYISLLFFLNIKKLFFMKIYMQNYDKVSE